MVVNTLWSTLLALSMLVRWGTMDDAEQLFRDHKRQFVEIYALTVLHPEIKNVSSALDPYEETEFIPKYREFTEESKAAYTDILQKMAALNLSRVRVDRFTGLKGAPMEIVGFLVFSRGLGGGTEGIAISHVKGDESVQDFHSDKTVCRPIDPPEWHVCSFK